MKSIARIFLAGGIALPLLLLCGNALADQVSGTWTASLLEADGPEEEQTLKLRLRTRGEHGMRSSFIVPLSRLSGFSPDQLATGAELRFSWPHEAGSLEFEGIDRWWWWPAGSFTFHPNTEFAARLSGDDSVHDLFRLALHGGGNRLFQLMVQLGYSGLTSHDLVRLDNYDVSPELIQATQDLAYRPTVEELVRLRRYGIGGKRIREYTAAELRQVPVEDLIRYYRHGVPTAYIARLAALGIAPDDVDAIIRLDAHGLTADTVEALKSVERFELSTDELIQLDSHGVEPRFFSEITAFDIDGLTVDEIIRLYQHGVRADFVRRVVESGTDSPSVDELIDRFQRGDPRA